MRAPTYIAGWRHLHSGKVRDLYVPEVGDGTMLMVASDRISAFDFVLTPTIPDKGAILTAMSAWWLRKLRPIVANHVVAEPVPSEVSRRAMRVRALEMVPVEAVVRGYLAGSGLQEYRQTGAVCGVQLPAGLEESAKLPEPIFTPATKAALGEHDENVSFSHVAALMGLQEACELREVAIELYRTAAGIAAARGIILADTKFEFGFNPEDGSLVLADEALTPDSSRFWEQETWQVGRTAVSFDKQYVRDWLVNESGWDRGSGTAPPPLPDSVVAATRERYLEAYRRLTGTEFETGH